MNTHEFSSLPWPGVRSNRFGRLTSKGKAQPSNSFFPSPLYICGGFLAELCFFLKSGHFPLQVYKVNYHSTWCWLKGNYFFFIRWRTNTSPHQISVSSSESIWDWNCFLSADFKPGNPSSSQQVLRDVFIFILWWLKKASHQQIWKLLLYLKIGLNINIKNN